MIPALIFGALVAFAGWLAYLLEGPVVLEDATDTESLFALGVAALVLLFAFIVPDLQGQNIPRWRVRLFGVAPFFALAAVVFPSVTAEAPQTLFTPQGVRKFGIVVLVVFFLVALFT